MLKVHVLSKNEISVGYGENAAKEIRVTFQAEGYPQLTTWIDKSKFNKENLKAMILDLMQRRLGVKEMEIELVQ